MVSKDKSYRFRLPTKLFNDALRKAKREDLTLAQVLRRFIRAWIDGEIELPHYSEDETKDK